MKKVLFNVFLVGITALSIGFSGCKKGKDDPAISLKSRDKRIEESWKLTKWTKTTTNSSTDSTGNYQTTTTYNLDGSSDLTVTTTTTGGSNGSGTSSNSTSNSTTSISTYSETLDIQKGGTYTMTTTNSSGSTTHIMDTTNTDTETNKGFWRWGSDNKNKDQLVLDNDIVYQITKLSSKEMVLKRVSESDQYQSQSYTTNYVGIGSVLGGTTNSSSYTTTETKTYSR